MEGFNLDDYEVVVLGCTHFPFFKREIENFFPHATIMDGAAGTIKNLIRVLGNQSLDEKYSLEVYESGQKVNNQIFEKKYIPLLNKAKVIK